jgi:benzoyl-CoA reductase/2-hydroxyglutaryl-CoA dehydratase subunit BcrC/BadD/HgdB
MQISPDKHGRRNQLKKLFSVIKEHGAQQESAAYSLRASQKRVNLTAKFFKKSYREDAKVAYRSVIMPTEIFFAMDMVPVCPEAVSAMLASSALGPYVLNIAEQNHYSRDVCSFTRCTLGAAIDNFLPTPDFLASTSYYCDNTNKLFSILGKMYGKDYFLLDIPYDYKSSDSLDYLTGQLKEMTALLEKRSGKKMDREKLAETVNLANEAREYFIKVNELRTSIPAPISGGEAIDFAALLAFTWGSKDMVDLCRELYEEIKEKVENNREPQNRSRRPRILWRHLRPYYDNSLIDFIEKDLNCDIVFEEINFIHWGEMDPDDPFKSIARKLILNSPVGPIEHWMEDSFGLLEKYQVDAVMSFNHWGCRQLSSTNQIFKDELKKRNIPALELGGDCIDNRNYSFQQMKTRIQAFIEMVEDMN